MVTGTGCNQWGWAEAPFLKLQHRNRQHGKKS